MRRLFLLFAFSCLILNQFTLSGSAQQIAQTPSTQNDTGSDANTNGARDAIIGVLGALGIYELLHHRHHTAAAATPFPMTTSREASPTPFPMTTSREPSPTPFPTTTSREASPTPFPTTTSRDATPEPTEVPTGVVETIPPSPPACGYRMEDGWFEPTQGVWQDDPFFQDMSGKQLTRLHDMDPIPHYEAELNMIEDRDTVFFGVNRYEDRGAPVTINSRNTIVLKFRTNCSQSQPARLIFTITQRGQTKHIVYPTVFNIPIAGPPFPGASSVFTVSVPAGAGIPAASTFTLDEGNYEMDAEMITISGEHTGIKAAVTGHTERTYPPTLHFVPMDLFYGPTPPSAPTALNGVLIKAAEALRIDSAKTIPDYYPIAPGSLPTVRERLWYVSWDAIKNNDYYDAARWTLGWVLSGGDSGKADIWANLPIVDRFKTGISNLQGFASYINGANRMVIVMLQIDYQQLMGTMQLASFNLGNKAVLVNTAVSSDTVGHEIAHTIPPPNWDPNPECDKPYHNTGVTGVVPDPYGPGTTANGYAAGERLRLSGVPKRILTDGTIHIMGGAILGVTKRVYAYTTQCTYWHLSKEMEQPPDPKVRLVRAVLARRGERYDARLGPEYTLDGNVDLSSKSKGPWTIALQDAGHRNLSAYSFTPAWNDENGGKRNALAIVYRVPDLPNTAYVVLTGPDRTRVWLRSSAQAPRVRITSLSSLAQDGTATLTWQADTDARYPHISSVFVSDDGGRTYHQEVLETQGTSAAIHFTHQTKNHRVKLLVSDYTRSSEALQDVTW